MEHCSRIARGSALAAVGVSAMALLLVAGAMDGAFAAAKSKPQAAAPAEAGQNQQDPQKAAAAAARQSYDAGIKSYAAGKFQPAVDQMSSALRGGGLGSSEMAKAMYIRGLAYKKLSKPGLAISDLTSALWLKNGLGEADQKVAIAERAEAYRLAGLGDGNSGSDKVSVADPNPSPAGKQAAAPAPTIAAPAAAPASAKSKSASATAIVPAAAPAVEITRQSPESEAAKEAAHARRMAALPVENSGMQNAVIGSLVGSPAPAAATTVAPQQVAVAAPAAAPNTLTAAVTPTVSAPFTAPAATTTAPVVAAAPIGGVPPVTAPATTPGPSTVTNFFSNLFGGGSSSAAAPAQPASTVTTASTTPAASSANWADSTSVAKGAVKPSVAQAPVAAAAAPAAAAAVKPPAGKYKLHIAAVRSRAEAEALAQKLTTQQGAALKSRMPIVDEAVIGSMGTFYRVRVGAFATPDESRGVCNTLRSSGFDCLVVTN
jgi:SPOR domain